VAKREPYFEENRSRSSRLRLVAELAAVAHLPPVLAVVEKWAGPGQTPGNASEGRDQDGCHEQQGGAEHR
jgi:hypothetical protein